MQLQKIVKLWGLTNPANADVGTIRKNFALSIGKQIQFTGSDSEENAKNEVSFFCWLKLLE